LNLIKEGLNKTGLYLIGIKYALIPLFAAIHTNNLLLTNMFNISL